MSHRMISQRSAHIKSLLRAFLPLCALFISPLALAKESRAKAHPQADLVIWGGLITTQNKAVPEVEALAIAQGRFAYIGDQKGAKTWIGPKTQVIDLKGTYLYPGFTDSHVHLDGIGQRELTLNLEGSASLEAALERLQAWIAPLASQEVVWGRGWIETHWPENRILTAADLDRVSGDHAVILVRADGHALVMNTKAMQALGLTPQTPSPFGGEIGKTSDGALSGLLVDNAMKLAAPLMPKMTEAYRQKVLKTALKVETTYGWSGVHYMSASFEDILALETMARTDQLPLRVYAAIKLEDASKLLASGPRSEGDGRMVTRAIKILSDGSLGSHSAALFEPYSDAPETRGLETLQSDKMLDLFAKAKDLGLQMATHAIGDRANSRALDLYEKVLKGANLRWRIEHAQILRPQDIKRMAKDHVIASMQPSHAIGDFYFAPQRLGPKRLKGAYAWQSLRQAGAVVIGGSDSPVERGDPLIEFYAAVARKSLEGYSNPDWHQEERLSRAQALDLFTTHAAYGRFGEGELGRIKLGYRADLIGFSVDLMHAPEAMIPKGHAVLTVVDGQVVCNDLKP